MDKNALKTIQDLLEKARKRLSDEEPDASDRDDNESSYNETEPEVGESSDDADRWLKDKPNHSDSEGHEEYTPGEDEEAHQEDAAKQEISVKKLSPRVPEKGMQIRRAADQGKPADVRGNSKYPQPTRDELNEMRQYTRPWEQRERDRAKLEADPRINPIKHHDGRLIEARNLSHSDRQQAYGKFQESPDYQAADPITQMEMDAQFHKDWHGKNPDHIHNALRAHSEANKKGLEAQQLHTANKDEAIRHVGSGGAQAGSMSVEEGLQHLGQEREEDETPGGISHDPSASFAAGNQDFINQYMANYDKKAKKPMSSAELADYDPGTRADVARVLGDHPALKDPRKKAKVDSFFAKYQPAMTQNARQAIKKMGLDESKGEIDYGLLHEAGMRGLFQSINDYDHDHPSKASFVTHMNRKAQGLMQAALKTQDQVPQALRTAAKQFNSQQGSSGAPVKHTNKEGVTSIINQAPAVAAPTMVPSAPKKDVASIIGGHPPEVQERLQRVVAAKAPMTRKTAIQPVLAAPAKKRNINRIDSEESE